MWLFSHSPHHLCFQIESDKKYAKWKAAYIHRCLKAGQTPYAVPLPEDGEEGKLLEVCQYYL